MARKVARAVAEAEMLRPDEVNSATDAAYRDGYQDGINTLLEKMGVKRFDLFFNEEVKQIRAEIEDKAIQKRKNVRGHLRLAKKN